MKSPRSSFAIVLVASLLAACGGGGGYAGTSPFPGTTSTSPPPPPGPGASLAAAAGLWRGTTSSNRQFTALVLADGTYEVIYSVAGSPSLIGGVTQGKLAVSGSLLLSSNGRDFNLEGMGLNTAAVSATAKAKSSFVGSITYTGGTAVQFTSSYDATFEQTPSLADLAGSFAGQAVTSNGVQATNLTIAATGDVSGTVAGCRFTGTAAARSDANAFNVSIAFAGPPCLFANQTLGGLAYYEASSRTLIALAPNLARTDGFLAVAAKN